MQDRSTHDARQDPEIPPATVFQALFYAFVFRLCSFKELEVDLAQPQLQHRIDAPRAACEPTSAIWSLVRVRRGQAAAGAGAPA